MGENRGGDPRPFLASDAGLSSRQRKQYRRLLRGVYTEPTAEPTALTNARAAWEYSGGRGVLGGRSAAAALGVRYLDQRERTEISGRGGNRRRKGPADEADPGRYRYFDSEPPVLYRPRHGTAKTTDGLVVHTADIPEDQIVQAEGMRVTSPDRTGLDLARWPAMHAKGWNPGSYKDLEQRVILLDSLLHATRITPDAITALITAHPRMHGLRRARQAVSLADPGGQSPQETKLRLLLMYYGLPRPQTQVPVADRFGYQFAHLDLGWPRWKVGTEYDGTWHWIDEEQRAIDIERYAEYAAAGWDVLRVEKRLMYGKPGFIAEELRTRLRSAGAPV